MQFQKSKYSDYILTCCNWVYDEEEALKYYHDVKIFLNILFPLPEVLKMVMKWIACSLNGRNNSKRALILTDDTNGDNGKSSFLALIRKTFDIYIIEGLKYLTSTRASNNFKNENSHASGLFKLKNKRLLYVDETQQDYKLNTGEFNNFVSGETLIEGRHFGSDEQFRFKNTASVLFACNENKFPEFSADDKTMTKRLLVVKMLTCFVDDVNDLENVNLKYVQQKIDCFESRFDLWKSAFLKILMEYYDANGFSSIHDVPQIVKDYSLELINKRLSQNVRTDENLEKLQEFISKKMIYVENKMESCTIQDLKTPLKDFGLENLVKGKHWVIELRSLLGLCGIKVIECTNWSFNKKLDKRKNKIINMKLK